MKLFKLPIKKKIKPKTIEPVEEAPVVDDDIPSVNKKTSSSKLITYGGFAFILLAGAVTLYGTMGGEGGKSADGQPMAGKKAEKKKGIENNLPEVDFGAPPPLSDDAPKVANNGSAPPLKGGPTGGESGGAANPPGGGGGPIVPKFGGGAPSQPQQQQQQQPLSWFDRKRLGSNASNTQQITMPTLRAVGGSDARQADSDDSVKAPTSDCSNPAECAKAAAKQSPLEGRLQQSAYKTIKATLLGNRNFLLAAGTAFDASLLTAIDSTQPGIVKATLSADLYSDNGSTLLLERGSELTGESGADLEQGQERIFITWTRVKTQNGVVVSLNSPSSDPLGRAGMDGYIDTKFKERFGAAILMSLIRDIPRGGTNGSTVVLGNTVNAGDKVIEKSLESTANVRPVLSKNQGERITVMAASDIDFSGVYKLQLRK